MIGQLLLVREQLGEIWIPVAVWEELRDHERAAGGAWWRN